MTTASSVSMLTWPRSPSTVMTPPGPVTVRADLDRAEQTGSFVARLPAPGPTAYMAASQARPTLGEGLRVRSTPLAGSVVSQPGDHGRLDRGQQPGAVH